MPQRESRKDSAEDLAMQALGFIAADQDRLLRFLDLTGLSPATIRSAANQPQFLTAVLDHLLSDEPLLLQFAAEAECNPNAIAHARERLAGPVAFGLRDG